jgi:hypothetical protein
MSPTRPLAIPSPLAVEYQEMKKRAVRDGERSRPPLAAVRSSEPEGEDRVTISSDHSPENADSVRTTRSKPVTPEERLALMQAFSIHV